MGLELHPRKRIAKPLFNQPDGKVGDINPDPLPPEFLRRLNRGATTEERVEHDIAGVGGGVEDTLQQDEAHGSLEGISRTFLLARCALTFIANLVTRSA